MEAASTSELEPLTPDPVPGDPHMSAARPAPAAKPAVRQETPASVAPIMDRDFIARNQIIERYISGKLPVKGATEFERYCKEHPELLDELGLPERVNAALRLLEASGKPEPWETRPRRFWEKPQLVIGLGTAVLVLLVTSATFASRAADRAHKIAHLTQQVAEQPLEPAQSTRTIRILPSHSASVGSPAVVLGGGRAELADLRFDMSRSPYREYRVTIDRVDQGRVGVIHNLMKDSNGHLRIALNSSALGPGNYQFTIEGLTWRGDPEPDSWITIGIARSAPSD
jgi:hypothetical protein